MSLAWSRVGIDPADQLGILDVEPRDDVGGPGERVVDGVQAET